MSRTLLLFFLAGSAIAAAVAAPETLAQAYPARRVTSQGFGQSVVVANVSGIKGEL